nr:DUF364 domain-containing protein [uncultured Holophaga sp.]
MNQDPLRGGHAGILLDEAHASLVAKYAQRGEAPSILRLVVGIHFVGVKLTNGCGGVAYLPPELIQAASTRILKHAAPRVRGMSALGVAGGGLDHPLAHVIRLATLNALSVPFFQEGQYLMDETGNLADYPALFNGRRLCLVGAIIPLLRRIRHLPSHIDVVDRKEATEAEAGGMSFVPPDQVSQALGSCETAVFTGASVANGSVLSLIAQVPEQAAIAIVGPSSGFIPDPLFERGVALVGTSIVHDIDEALEILSEGGGAYQLFGTCVRKINLLNVKALAGRGLALPGAVEDLR